MTAESTGGLDRLFDDRQAAQHRRQDHARQEVMSATARIVLADAEHRGEDPRDAFQPRPLFPGREPSLLDNRPKWPLQLAAAQALVSAARTEVTDALKTARGYAAATWAEIAEQLGYTGDLEDPDGYPMSPAVAAWKFAVTGRGPGERAGSGYGWDPAFTWRCWSCNQAVSEGHPENGTEAQRGHSNDCERFARERAAERAKWDDSE